MREIVLYQCEVCKKNYKTVLEAERCEAGHYALTRDEYNEWRGLYKKVIQAGRMVGIRKSPETDRAFEEAIKDQVDFEAAHGLDPEKVPTSFYR